MKKIIKPFICLLIGALAILPVAACGGNSDGKDEDLQTRLEQQEELLRQQNELLQQLQSTSGENIKELQEQIAELNKKIEELQISIYRLEKGLTYDLAFFAQTGDGSGLWDNEGAYLFDTSEQMQSYLDKIRQCREDSPYINSDEWSVRTDDGVFINEQYLSERYDNNYYESKSLIVAVFETPNMPATLSDYFIWTNGNNLTVQIDYSYGDATAMTADMVVLEVEKYRVENIQTVDLKLNAKNID